MVARKKGKKLTGAAKKAFVARMAKGRKKAAAAAKRRPKTNGRRKLAKRGKSAVKRNPVPLSKAAKTEHAVQLYQNFTGMDPKFIEERSMNVPDVGLVIGKCFEIRYTTVRDNKTEHYKHTFSGRSRPTLCSSWDGKQIFFVDGNYSFKADGINDL